MHLSDKQLIRFHQNRMDVDEMLPFLEHIGQCTHCAGRLSSLDDPHMIAPSYLKEEIVERSSQLDIQTSLQIKRVSKNMQLFYYSLRTAAAMAVALFLLFAVNQASFQSGPPQFTPPKAPSLATSELSSTGKQVLNTLNDFTSKLLYGGNNDD